MEFDRGSLRRMTGCFRCGRLKAVDMASMAGLGAPGVIPLLTLRRFTSRLGQPTIQYSQGVMESRGNTNAVLLP